MAMAITTALQLQSLPSSFPLLRSPFISFSFSLSLICPRFHSPKTSVKSSVLPLKGIQCIKNEVGADPKKGVSVYKPKSYQVLVSDAADSLFYALNDGKTRLEIDFP